MRLSPHQLARDQRELVLELPLSEFPRLAALVLEDGGAVRVRVRFFADDQGRTCMAGQLDTRQVIRCANCELPGTLELVASVDACLLKSDTAVQELIGDMDALVLEGPHVSPAQLFEDDLLLALPERPCNGAEQCPNQPRYEPEPEPVPERDNPFAVLASIKKSSRSD